MKLRKSSIISLAIILSGALFMLGLPSANAACDVLIDEVCEDVYCEGTVEENESCAEGSGICIDNDVDIICTAPPEEEVVRVDDWAEDCTGGETGDPCGPVGAESLGTCQLESESTGRIVCIPPGAEEEDDDEPATARLQSRNLDNPLGTDNLQEIIARIITIFTSIAGSVALLMFVYGGIMWLTSGGSPERIDTGKRAIIWATVGLVVIFGAYAILRAIFSAFGANL